jgi:hypothetical protein
MTKHDPNFKHRKWAPEEDRIIIEKFNKLGGKWIKISTFLNNRSSIAIKNRYYSVLRKRLPSTEETHPEPSEPRDQLIQMLDQIACNYEYTIQAISRHLQNLEESIEVDMLVN